MGTLLTNVGLPLFASVRRGALGDLVKVITDHHLTFGSALIVTGRSATKSYARRAATALRRNGLKVHVESVGAASFSEVDRLKTQVIESVYPDVLLAVGGGSVIDVAKLAAAEKRLSWISVPTAASNDGFCSPVAVLSTDAGEHRSVGGTMPMGVIGDLDVLAAAPARLQRAGVGDLISNLTACADWDLAAKRGKAAINDMARMLAVAGPRQVLGAKAIDLSEPQFLRTVVEGLILSGVAMEICGTSRPCSGSEHLISHALDAAGTTGALHGEQVGVASIFCCALQDGDWSAMRRFARRVGLADRPGKLGISRADFLDAVRRGPRLRPGRWTILNSVARRRDALEKAFDTCFGK